MHICNSGKSSGAGDENFGCIKNILLVDMYSPETGDR